MIINQAYAEDSQIDTITLQDSDALPQAPESIGSSWTSLVPMVLIFAVFYFLLIRPQEKRRRAQQEVVSGVKKGEEILTTSGIIGIVSKINDSDNTVLLSIAKDVEIKILKTSISDILSRTKKEEVKAIKATEKKKGNSSKK
ncbi:MAG: preprotein translocase subunit YajC [Rickettsiaceae bacterium]